MNHLTQQKTLNKPYIYRPMVMVGAKCCAIDATRVRLVQDGTANDCGWPRDDHRIP